VASLLRFGHRRDSTNDRRSTSVSARLAVVWLCRLRSMAPAKAPGRPTLLLAIESRWRQLRGYRGLPQLRTALQQVIAGKGGVGGVVTTKGYLRKSTDLRNIFVGCWCRTNNRHRTLGRPICRVRGIRDGWL
jgi:hypothetical protein